MTKIDGRGKAPKAGKGVGRKPLAPELKKEETKTVSIRLPVSSIKFHGIDGAWLFDAATQKIERQTGINLAQPYEPDAFGTISKEGQEKAAPAKVYADKLVAGGVAASVGSPILVPDGKASSLIA